MQYCEFCRLPNPDKNIVCDFCGNSITLYSSAKQNQPRYSMSETNRFKAVSVIKQNKWLLGCPVIIDKGMLLADQLNSKNILQLKLRNISSKKIIQADLQVYQYDLAGDLITGLEDPIPVSYTDVNASARETFGDRKAIILGSSAVRAVKIVFLKVVYNDQQVWRNEDQQDGSEFPLAEISSSVGQELSVIYNWEYYKRYPPKANKETYTHHYLPVMHQDSWICTCGLPNLIDADFCGRM